MGRFDQVLTGAQCVTQGVREVKARPRQEGLEVSTQQGGALAGATALLDDVAELP